MTFFSPRQQASEAFKQLDGGDLRSLRGGLCGDSLLREVW